MNLNSSERMLFALLRAALHQCTAETALFEKASEEDWKGCYRLSVVQGVRCLAWDGLCTLPPDLRPLQSLMRQWGLGVSYQESRYRCQVDAVGKLAAFYAEKGIRTLLLKGVGLSVYYPCPAHRECGDIDIYTCSGDLRKRSDTEANRLADLLMEKQGIEVDRIHSKKHSLFYYERIPVENHKTFLNVETYAIAGKMETLLHRLLSPRPAELGNGQSVYVPSPAFNTLFLAFHSAQHFYGGLALRHVCDWACLLAKEGFRIPEEVTDKRLRDWMVALSFLCHRYLGFAPVEVSGQEELAETLLREILRPSYPDVVPVQGKVGIILFKWKRMRHRYRLGNKVLPLPFYRWVAHSVVSHLRDPETIFRRRR